MLFDMLQLWARDQRHPPPKKHAALADAAVSALRDHNNQTCRHLRCCKEYVFHHLEAGPTVEYPHWAKVRLVLELLLTNRNRPVVFLDMDAFLLDRTWCPSFSPSDGMLIAPDPKPWSQPLNAGFLAVQNSATGVAIMRSWWREYERNASSCWEVGGACEQCRRNFSSCVSPCIYGGSCSDQFALKAAVWPAYERQITVLPKSFQDTSLTCNGTVKHFAAGYNRLHVLQILSKCGSGGSGGSGGGGGSGGSGGSSSSSRVKSVRDRRAEAAEAMVAASRLGRFRADSQYRDGILTPPPANPTTSPLPTPPLSPPSPASDYLSSWRVSYIHVLSLRRRLDRRALMATQAANLSVPLSFVDAFDCQDHPPLVPLNCVHLSWQQALLAALERDVFPCLITEDDIELRTVRLPRYELPQPPSLHGARPAPAFVALAAKLNYSRVGHCDEAAASRLEHVVTLEPQHAFGFAAQYFQSAAGARELLSFFWLRSSYLDDWADVAAFSKRFGRAAATCPPLLGYHAMPSSTRLGETRESTLG